LVFEAFITLAFDRSGHTELVTGAF